MKTPRELAEDDARMFGNGFVRIHPDGQTERIPPEQIIIHGDSISFMSKFPIEKNTPIPSPEGMTRELKHPVPGKFIALEGGEGAGKSTQAQIIKSILEKSGREVVMTREPGGTPAAEEIRRMLVEGDRDRWTPLSEVLLFLAARVDHIEKLIVPSLEAGKWVISDRFTLSTIVYQGVGRRLGIERVRIISDCVLGRFDPDLTIVLDVSPPVGLARAASRSGAVSRFEAMDSEFHRAVAAGYRSLVGMGWNTVAVDADRPLTEVSRDVALHVRERLNP